MSWLSDIGTWLTGRNELYLDSDKLETVYSDIDDIKKVKIENAKNDCHDAIVELNKVKGMSYIGPINETAFDEIYDLIGDAVVAIRTQIEEKQEGIEAYSNASTFSKITSSIAMGAAKFGEGFLSVFEAIGDGLASVGGFLAGAVGNKDFQNSCAEFVKRSWSHDVFNFYYKSDFAKASAFTEDSGIASIAKLTGEVTGYLALGGFVSGAAGSVSKVGKVANFLSSTKKVNTLTATLQGIGQGTETGLNNGLDYNDAFKQGLTTGAKYGATAWAFGTLGEKGAKNAAIKEAEKKMANAQKGLDDAAEAFEAANNAGSAEAFEAANKAASKAADAYRDATSALEKAKNATYQGYNDAITKAGQQAGKSTVSTVKNIGTNISQNVADKGLIKGVGKSIGQGASTIKSKVGSVVSRPQAAPTLNDATSVLGKTREAAVKVADVVTAPVKALGEGAVTAIKSQPSVVGKVAVAGVEAYGVGEGLHSTHQNEISRQLAPKLTDMKASTQSIYNEIPNSINNLVSDGTSTSDVTGPGDNAGNNIVDNTGGNTGGNSGAGAQPSSSYVPTPSSNTSSGTTTTPSGKTTDGTTTTPSEKPSDGNTTTPGTNDKPNNNNDNKDNGNKSDDSNKTPDKTTPTTPEPTPTPSDNGSTVISNPPSNNNQGSSGTNHGGTTNNNTGNSSTGNNNWSSNTTTEPGIEENPELEPELPIEDTDLIDEPGEEESVYTIPSNLSGVKETKKSSSGSSILPVLGGLGAAAAVGVGAKMYLDNKKNNENGDDDEEYSEEDDFNTTSENDDLLADEWNGEDTEFNYEEPSGDNIVGTDDDLGEM